MSILRATKFKVTNFRNINDSGWIHLERITAFVGRNESGKTTLLKGLHKFNAASKEKYEAQREFPRDRFTRDYKVSSAGDIPVCAVEFSVTPEFTDLVTKTLLFTAAPETVVCTRFYDMSLTVEAYPPVADPPVRAQDLAGGFDTFMKAARRLATLEGQEEQVQAVRQDLLEWATKWKEALASHDDLRAADGRKLLAQLTQEMSQKSGPLSADAIEVLEPIVTQLKAKADAPSVEDTFEKLVTENLPVFIYFENYGVLDSAIYLPRFIEDLKRAPVDPRIRTINAMFRHVDLSAEDIEGLGREAAQEARRNGQPTTDEAIAKDQERKHLRSVKMNSASLDITRRFTEWWRQRRHAIEYEVDGSYFRIWVSDDRRPGVKIELEARSKGFQWFFSFYLVFLVESEDGHRDAVLLLDEPGLHLHPTAQQDLIGFFEGLSEKNQIVYSTHSPFLVDGEHLHRIRPVVEDETGHSTINPDGWPADRETIFPLQAAAAYAMMRSLFRHRKNMLVEGMADYFYLHALAAQCRAAGRMSLPEEIHVTPCGGAKHISQMASLFLGNQARALVLLDSDNGGRERELALLKDLYAHERSGVLMLGTVLAQEECEIEDLVGPDEILPVVSEMAGKPLKLAEEDAQSSLPDRIKAAAARAGVELPNGWKGDVARRLATKWSSVPVDKFPGDILARAERFFADVNSRFEAMKQ